MMRDGLGEMELLLVDSDRYRLQTDDIARSGWYRWELCPQCNTNSTFSGDNF